MVKQISATIVALSRTANRRIDLTYISSVLVNEHNLKKLNGYIENNKAENMGGYFEVHYSM